MSVNKNMTKLWHHWVIGRFCRCHSMLHGRQIDDDVPGHMLRISKNHSVIYAWLQRPNADSRIIPQVGHEISSTGEVGRWWRSNHVDVYLCICSTIWGQVQVVLWLFFSCGFSIKYIYSFIQSSSRTPTYTKPQQLPTRTSTSPPSSGIPVSRCMVDLIYDKLENFCS